jgi:hypothetical protein
MSEGHDEQADRLEREVEELQERHDRVEGDIESARKDWETKKQDPGVPGAVTSPKPGAEGGGPAGDTPVAEGDEASDSGSELIDPRDEGE